MSKPKYPYIKIVRTVKERMEPELVKARVLTALNRNPQVAQKDIKRLIIALDRLSEHAASDEYDALYSQYVTLQKSGKA